MIDCNFPLIEYAKNKTPLDWGLAHGEEFRDAIKELVEIRRELMLAKNPSLKPRLKEYSIYQWDQTFKFAPDLSDELKGIAEGSSLSLEDIVILNNYTDFRDLEMPEEGCSTIHLNRGEEVIAGQTWDMHGSAKKYVSTIVVPEYNETPAMVMFSLVGCVGMMGINTHGALVGVNNINTKNAKAGIMWPVLVRKLLQLPNREKIVSLLTSAPVTSGHNYIIADKTGGEHWEVTPEVGERVSCVELPTTGETFHTNHCLAPKIIELEDSESLSSTTHARFDLITNKIKDVNSYSDLKTLLTDHDNYPKSICSHFESGAQDPSFTCGGAVADLTGVDSVFWRGCPVHDDNYVEYSFKLQNGNFERQK